jgi:hypothetical protein
MAFNVEGTFKAKVTVGQVSVELEGSEDFVRGELAFLKEKLLSETNVGRSIETAIPSPHEAAPDMKSNIKAFVGTRTVESDPEKAVIVAYFLLKHKNITEIDAKTLSEWCPKAGLKPPKNPYQTIKDAKRRNGYFDKGSTTGKFKISDTGIYFVEHEWGTT